MGMTIEQAEKLLDDLATQEEFLCKRADDASGYTRSGNESIRTSNAKTHEQHAKEYRQILRYLAEYRLMQANYEIRLKADMVAMLEELKKEMNLIKECEYQIYGNEHWNFVGKCQDVIQKKIDELREGVKEKPKSCSTCRSYKSHAGHCEICHEMSMYKEVEE